MSAPQPKPNSRDLSGARLLGGRIELIERLGAGAFGAVYRAQEYVLGEPLRQVAVKLTHRTHLADEEAREALEEGFTLARVAAQCRDALARPHLIQVFDLGIAADLDGRAYTVLEFVPGVLLMKHIQSFGPSLPMATVRRYFLQMCRAIAACHGLDPPITHGDLKPDNVLVDLGQTIRIVDFGLARPIDRLAGYAVDPGVCLSYCAPEALLGRGLPQSDMYSLGLIIYELLTGGGPHQHIEPPPEGSNRYYYHKQKHAMRFQPLAELHRGLSPDAALFAIVERCLKFDPEDRFECLRDVMEQLADEDSACRTEPVAEFAGIRADSTKAPKSGDFGYEASAADAVPTPDWRQRAERCLLVEDWQAGLKAVSPLGASDPEAAAYEAIFLAQVGQERKALERGMNVLLKHRSGLSSEVKLRLIGDLQELLARSSDPGMRPYENILHSLVGRG